MSALHFSPEARGDLLDIKRYIAEELASPEAAESTLRKIMKKIRMLEDSPEIGAPLSPVINIETRYRYLVCGNYLAFYYTEPDNVYIVRVLYGRRDYVRILFGDLPEDS